ncbi:hypothetical protein SDC9_195089 [bioreactor metagenome]|uniref:Uncharacterized protein n=1 Tax=bioreactor metagenome TaxID=1076179 RepID=A0A645I808_9ZZZZ
MEITRIGNLIRPIPLDHTIFNIGQILFDKLGIGQNAHHFNESTPWLTHHG